MAQLRFFDDNGSFETCNLGTKPFVIGRLEQTQLRIVDDRVSREHSRIERDADGRYRIRDLGSRTKTIVNGQPVTETLLTEGDIIRIGGTVLEFVDNGTAGELIDLSFLAADRTAPPETKWLRSKMPVTLPLERLGPLSILGAGSGYPPRVNDVASAALSQLMLLIQADRGFIALRGEAKNELHPVAQRGFLDDARTIPVSRAFAYTAFLQSSAGRYPERPKPGNGSDGLAAAALAAPLLDRNKVIGVVYVDKPMAGQVFPETALQEIAAAGAHIGALISDSSKRLLESESTIGEAWLSTLRRLQLAATIPPTDSKSFSLAVKLLPGRVRCGDFFDVIHVGEDRTFIVMIDAGGQGVDGFVQAAAIRTALRTAFTVEGGTLDLGAILTSINATILAKQARALVTCTVLDFDLTAGQLRYINAGGPMPLLIPGPSRLVTLDQASLLLGVDANYHYAATSMALPTTFYVVCHTDGLTDMRNAVGEQFGAQHLHHIILERGALSSVQEFLAWIVGETERHRNDLPPDDDSLICVISHG